MTTFRLSVVSVLSFLSAKLGRCPRCIRLAARSTLAAIVSVIAVVAFWPHPLAIVITIAVASVCGLVLLGHLAALVLRPPLILLRTGDGRLTGRRLTRRELLGAGGIAPVTQLGVRGLAKGTPQVNDPACKAKLVRVGNGALSHLATKCEGRCPEMFDKDARSVGVGGECSLLIRSDPSGLKPSEIFCACTGFSCGETLRSGNRTDKPAFSGKEMSCPGECEDRFVKGKDGKLIKVQKECALLLFPNMGYTPTPDVPNAGLSLYDYRHSCGCIYFPPAS